MELYVDLQIASENEQSLPELAQIETWVNAAIMAASDDIREEAELTVRIVDAAESQELIANIEKKINQLMSYLFLFKTHPGSRYLC